MKQGSARDALMRRLESDQADLTGALYAAKLESLSEEELDEILAEAGVDFEQFNEQFDALLAPYLAAQSAAKPDLER